MKIFFIIFVLYFYFVSSKENNKVRVAFIFAGSARSFLIPVIRNSILHNVILSFCPPRSCDYDVFVRLSIRDNKHIGPDSVGTFSDSDDQLRKSVFDAMETLEPNQIDGNLFLEIVDVGSPLEKYQIEEFASKNTIPCGNNFTSERFRTDCLNQRINNRDQLNFRHRIYRDLDSRRYSMYFNRYKAFELSLKEEERRNQPYDWIVHARLDTGWSGPILPHSSPRWKKDILYVPDTWFADVPDTFGIFSRSLADIYYSVDFLIQPFAMCLGGPNLHPNTMTTQSLQLKGYSLQEIKLIHEDDCIARFGSMWPIITEKKGNYTWAMAGFSEYNLKRKLEQHGVDFFKNNIIFTPFPIFISRYPMDFVCYLTWVDYFMPWNKKKQAASMNFLTACSNMYDDFHENKNAQGSLCHYQQIESELLSLSQSISSSKIQTQTPPPPPPDSKLSFSQKVLELSNKLQDPQHHPKGVCLSEYRNTNLNFLPFRIRLPSDYSTSSSSSSSFPLTEQQKPLIPALFNNDQSSSSSLLCLTSTIKSNVLNFSTCINHFRRKSYMNQFNDWQLFHFYPLMSTLPQSIRQWTHTEYTLCWTVSMLSVYQTLQQQKHQLSQDSQKNEILMKTFAVTLEKCDWTSAYPTRQRFLVQPSPLLSHKQQQQQQQQRQKQQQDSDENSKLKRKLSMTFINNISTFQTIDSLLSQEFKVEEQEMRKVNNPQQQQSRSRRQLFSNEDYFEGLSSQPHFLQEDSSSSSQSTMNNNNNNHNNNNNRFKQNSKRRNRKKTQQLSDSSSFVPSEEMNKENDNQNKFDQSENNNNNNKHNQNRNSIFPQSKLPSLTQVSFKWAPHLEQKFNYQSKSYPENIKHYLEQQQQQQQSSSSSSFSTLSTSKKSTIHHNNNNKKINNEEYCVVILQFPLIETQLFVQPCSFLLLINDKTDDINHENTDNNNSVRGHLLIVERTTSHRPILPGIQIGKFPES